MAPDTKFDQHLEEGLLPAAADEKGISTSRTTRTSNNKMTAARRVLLTVLVCGLMTLGLASAIGHRVKPCTRDHREQVPLDGAAVQDSAAQVDLLHRLLHAYFPERYQDGVYPSDKDAIAAFEADDVELASALGQLAKRQDNGTTTAPSATATTPSDTIAASPSVSSAPLTSETPAPTPTPTPTSAPAPSPSTPAASSTPAPATTVSSPPPVQSNTQQPTTAPSSQPAPTTPSAPATSAAPPTSDTRESSTVTRALPRTTSFREVRSTFTSTASNGDVVVVTQTSVVAVDPEATGAEPAESGSSGGGGLQNTASPIGGVSFALPFSLAGFVAGAMLLL
ncbi:hypothetical protein LX32DRAFT_729531 [Colletotrichum zoysiae]|uniref:Uncharacterized protein n=1 Tax=Colletotrichum zoysiae TaxID=1216348 RepID=A0AAD9HFC7_9PEZI|nr:hypothetical protein LX32DRAFT_729531 [Colletotrichum zoysiae]